MRGRPKGRIDGSTAYRLVGEGKPVFVVEEFWNWIDGKFQQDKYEITKCSSARELRPVDCFSLFSNYWFAFGYMNRKNSKVREND